jgi:hypothetical protein
LPPDRQVWLFPGRDPLQPLTTRQLNRACHAAARIAEIDKRVSSTLPKAKSVPAHRTSAIRATADLPASSSFVGKVPSADSPRFTRTRNCDRVSRQRMPQKFTSVARRGLCCGARLRAHLQRTIIVRSYGFRVELTVS